MTIEARTRSPLGAPYRSPLGAFGPGDAGPVIPAINGRFTGYLVNFGTDPDPPASCVFGIGSKPGRRLMQFTWTRADGQPLSLADWYAGVNGRWYRGVSTFDTIQAGFDPINLYCSNADPNGPDIYTQGYAPNSLWGTIQFFVTQNYVLERKEYIDGTQPSGWEVAQDLQEIPPP